MTAILLISETILYGISYVNERTFLKKDIERHKINSTSRDPEFDIDQFSKL